MLTADHSQTPVEHALPLADELAEDWAVLQPNTDRPEEAEIAVSPTSRAGAVYTSTPGGATPRLTSGSEFASTTPRASTDRGWRARDGSPVLRQGVGLPAPETLEVVVERNGFEFRFHPGGRLRDLRGNGWAVRGEPEALDGDVTRGRFESNEFPDALSRLVGAHLAARR